MKNLHIAIAGGPNSGQRIVALAIQRLLKENGVNTSFIDDGEGPPLDDLLEHIPEVFPHLKLNVTITTQYLAPPDPSGYYVVPIDFVNCSVVYYGEDHAYIQFYPLDLPKTEDVEKMVVRAAKFRFGSIFECGEVHMFDGKIQQITICPHPGTNLLAAVTAAGIEVHDER